MYVKQLIFKKLKKRSSCLRIIQNENRNFYTACVSEPPLEDRKRSYENRPVSFRNDATDTLDKLGVAYLATRPLALRFWNSGKEKLLWFKGEIYKAEGLSLSHSHFFFNDGINIGYFLEGKKSDDDEYLSSYRYN